MKLLKGLTAASSCAVLALFAIGADAQDKGKPKLDANGMPCEHLQVEGDGQHFFATIVSAEFEGKSRIARHQRVYQALGDRMKAQIHALSMKTLTPAEYSAEGAPHHHP